jgi:hypothetical protein
MFYPDRPSPSSSALVPVILCGGTGTRLWALVGENQRTYIQLSAKQRLTNPDRIPVEMIEVQSGRYLGEEDIVRIEDRYGRSALISAKVNV